MKYNSGRFEKGHKMSNEVIKKISKALLGKKLSEDTKNKISEARKGIKFSKETKEKISNAKKELYKNGFVAWAKGKTFSKIHKKRVSDSKKGSTPWNKGTKIKYYCIDCGKELKKSKAKRCKNCNGIFRSGKNHPMWIEDKSLFIYPVDWTKTLRQSIRERDKYTCQLCGENQGDRVLSVHHIDYDKKNCNPKNLISLCLSCHMKTNTLNKKKWIKYFINIKK